MKGLSDITVNSFNLPGDSPGKINLEINASIYNPSFVGMEIGDVYFDIIFQNNTIGSVGATDFILLNGRYLF